MLARNFASSFEGAAMGGMSANDAVYPVLAHPLDSRDLRWCCPAVPSLGEAWLAYLQHCWRRVKRGDLAYETVRRYAELRIRLDALGEMSIAELRSSDANTWHDRMGEQVGRLTGRPITRTADACRDLLAQICDFAELQNWRAVNSNPVRVVPRFGSKPRDIRLEEAECRRLISALDAVERRRVRRRYKNPLRQASTHSATQILRCLFLWARRPKELQQLRWEQLVDLDGARPIARKVRTKRGTRSLAVPQPVARILREQRTRVQHLSPLVFPSSVGRPITTLWHVWSEVLTVAELPHMPMYGLRHNGASHFIEGGLTEAEAAMVLENTEAAVHRHYNHATVSPAAEAAAQRAVDIMARIGGLS